MQELLLNVGIFGGAAIGLYYIYNNNMFGIRSMIEQGLAGATAPQPIQQQNLGLLPPAPIQQTPTTIGQPFSPTGSIPNPMFETGYSPGGGPIPGGAPGIDYTSAIYDSPFGTPSIDPRTGIDYSLYYPPTGVGTLPGTNPSPYPNPCLPGYYRASDLKCYPIPTQFPGNGCGTGMYLANDGRCYPYPGGAAGGGYGPGGGAGGGYAPAPCPLGEYRASDGKCYALPTPPPEACPTGAYRASDGKCYPITPGQTVGDCPAGYQMGSDGVCRASTVCPAGSTMQNGVCVGNNTVCPTGYTMVNGVCQLTGSTTTPPPGTTIPPLNIPLGPYMLIKILPPGVSPAQFCKECLHRSSMGHIDSDFWAAVISRPGIVPTHFAVIIKAEDREDLEDAIEKQNFMPLTPAHLTMYMPATSGFYGTTSSSFYSSTGRRYN